MEGGSSRTAPKERRVKRLHQFSGVYFRVIERCRATRYTGMTKTRVKEAAYAIVGVSIMWASSTSGHSNRQSQWKATDCACFPKA